MGIDVYPPFVPTTSGVAIFFKIESPVDVLITAPDGRRIGADLATGVPINDFGPAGYDSQTAEPRIYGVRDPVAGDFTIQTRRTADGPFTITTYGANLATDGISQVPFTGMTAIGIESMHQFTLDTAGAVTAAIGPDSDGDGIVDSLDDCTSVVNPTQLDADSDGYGNACDPDFDRNDVVNFADLAILKTGFFRKPGPSGLGCAGQAPCGSGSP